MKKHTAVDLFSGWGGLTLGLKLAGFRVLAAIENDKLAVETYRANHPAVQMRVGTGRRGILVDFALEA